MRGGKREGAGRPPGARNKVTAEIKEIAQQYGQEAIESLVKIMRADDMPPQARVGAIKEILDRGYGKSLQQTDLTNSDGSMALRGYAVIPELAKDMQEWKSNLPNNSVEE